MAEGLGVHVGERLDELSLGREPLLAAAENGGAEEVKRDRRRRVDAKRHVAVELHDADPALGARFPLGCVVIGSGEACVALFNAPVRVIHKLRRTESDGADDRHAEHPGG